MDLESDPFHLEVEFLLQRIDKSHADIAERSDVIGKDPNANAHGLYASCAFIGSAPEASISRSTVV